MALEMKVGITIETERHDDGAEVTTRVRRT